MYLAGAPDLHLIAGWRRPAAIHVARSIQGRGGAQVHGAHVVLHLHPSLAKRPFLGLKNIKKRYNYFKNVIQLLSDHGSHGLGGAQVHVGHT